MNIKRAAYEAVVSKVNGELSAVNTKISRNKWEIKKLVEAQGVLKRERGILVGVMQDLDATKNKDPKSKEA